MTAPKHWQTIMAHIQDDYPNSIDMAESAYMDLSESQDLVQFIKGDILLEAMNRTSRSSQSIYDHFRKLTGDDIKAMQSYVTVCRYWTPGLRWKLLNKYEHINFSHLKEITGYARQCGAYSAIRMLLSSADITARQIRRNIAIEQGKPKPKYRQVADVTASVVECISQQTNLIIQEHLSELSNKQTVRVVIYEILDDHTTESSQNSR